MNSIYKGILVATALGACLTSFPALSLDTEREDVRSFIDDMVTNHDFDKSELTELLAGATVQESILEAISRPAERVREWHEYREIFITPERIKAGVKFWSEHADTLQAVSKDTGVPPEILVGIIGVETYFGRITGRYTVLDALVTLGFDYPPRSKFFRRELGEFLLLAREEDIAVNAALGSYAGAMGAPQFIPSSYRAYAHDTDGDGKRDLFANWTDIIGSVANYFVAHKWRRGEEVIARAHLRRGFSLSLPKKNNLTLSSTVTDLSRNGLMFSTERPAESGATFVVLKGKKKNEYWAAFHNFYVITRYNRSVMYALAVWQLGQSIAAERDKGTTNS